VWVSFTLEDSIRCCLRSNEALATAVQSISQHAHLAAILVNCCAPDAVTAAVPVLKQHAPDGEQPSLANKTRELFCAACAYMHAPADAACCAGAVVSVH
jgi:S-methylmethionine-dependent homocysteine/selenocysteine methylase